MCCGGPSHPAGSMNSTTPQRPPTAPPSCSTRMVTGPARNASASPGRVIVTLIAGSVSRREQHVVQGTDARFWRAGRQVRPDLGVVPGRLLLLALPDLDDGPAAVGAGPGEMGDEAFRRGQLGGEVRDHLVVLAGGHLGGAGHDDGHGNSS